MKERVEYNDPKIEYLINEFVNAKKTFIGMSDEEVEIKKKDLIEGLQKVIYNSKKIKHMPIGTVAAVDNSAKELWLGKVFSKELQKSNNISERTIRVLIHEISHSWDKNIALTDKKEKRKYLYLNETLNEAKSQFLIDGENFTFPKTVYKDQESVFLTLCNVSGMNKSEFLKSIEGKSITQIQQMIARNTGNTIEYTTKYFENLAEISSTMFINLNKTQLNLAHRLMLYRPILKSLHKELLKKSNKYVEQGIEIDKETKKEKLKATFKSMNSNRHKKDNKLKLKEGYLDIKKTINEINNINNQKTVAIENSSEIKVNEREAINSKNLIPKDLLQNKNDTLDYYNEYDKIEKKTDDNTILKKTI